MTGRMIEALPHCHSLEDFYEICRPLGFYLDRRFMHLELDITNRCNIRCVMCYHSLESTRRTPTVHLTADDFARAAERILPHAYRLSLSLGNEPLMSPHFAEILAVAARYKVPHINFFTNGLLLTDASIGAIIEYGVTQVCVSIDGATAGTYNTIRRDGDFDRLVRNVKRLVGMRNERGRLMPRVRFDVVMTRRNVHELCDIVRLAARVGAQEMSFRHVLAFNGLGMESESLRHAPALSNYWLEKALELATELGLEVQGRPAYFDLRHPDERPPATAAVDASPFVAVPYCTYPFFHVTMTPGGYVLACPFAHGEPTYGRISDDTPLDRIWLNERFTTLRQRILRHDPPDMCRRCTYLGDRYPNLAQFFVTRTHMIPSE